MHTTDSGIKRTKKKKKQYRIRETGLSHEESGYNTPEPFSRSTSSCFLAHGANSSLTLLLCQLVANKLIPSSVSDFVVGALPISP